MGEFRTFESLLCTPDAVSMLAFKLFDVDNKGQVCFGKAKAPVADTTTLHHTTPHYTLFPSHLSFHSYKIILRTSRY